MRLTGLSIAVTGASGFCGAAVATAATAQGADVTCLARRAGPAGRHVSWDATREMPDLTGADAVIHLAAAVGDPGRRSAAEEEFRAVNVNGAQRLLAAGLSGEPALTGYAVDQMAHDVVLDLSKTANQGWQPRWMLRDYLATLH
jgi:nucleoside-diphosphate-sugar epimerase